LVISFTKPPDIDLWWKRGGRNSFESKVVLLEAEVVAIVAYR
jgi:hypothetical protein